MSWKNIVKAPKYNDVRQVYLEAITRVRLQDPSNKNPNTKKIIEMIEHIMDAQPKENKLSESED